MSDPPITAEFFTDPLSVRSWACQPLIRKFRYTFEEVQWVPRLTLLFTDTTDPTDVREGVADRSEIDDYWDSALRPSGMPGDGDLWSTELPDSSRPLCETVAIARERSPVSASAVLWRLQQRAFTQGSVPRNHERLADLAAEATRSLRGLPVEAEWVRTRLADGTGADLLEGDLERGREVVETLRNSRRETGELLDLAPRTRKDLDPGPGLGPERDSARETKGEGSSGDEPRNDETSSGDPTGSDERTLEDERDGDEGDGTDTPVPAIPAPPSVWVNRGDKGVLANPSDGEQALPSAARTFDRTAGDTANDPMAQATKTMSGYVAEPEVVEQLTTEDFGGKIRSYLEHFGEAFVPELTATVDCTERTCRRELRRLHTDGAVVHLDYGAWRLAPD